MGVWILLQIFDEVDRRFYIVSHQRDDSKEGHYTCGIASYKSWEECVSACWKYRAWGVQESILRSFEMQYCLFLPVSFQILLM